MIQREAVEPMSEKEQVEVTEAVSGTNDAKEVVELKVKLKALDMTGKKFFRRYRRALSMKRALVDRQAAIPEDIDEAVLFLKEYIVEPPPNQVEEWLWDLDGDQVLELFDRIMGTDSNAPNRQSGGA